MAHVLEQLVQAVATRVTGLTTTGSRVFVERPDDYPVDSTQLPALFVDEDGDGADLDAVDTLLMARQASIRITAKAKAVSGTSSTLRQVQLEVEQALATPITIGSASVRLIYGGSDRAVDASSDQPVGMRTIRFTTILYTNDGAADVAL